jgi:deazaflavin-dependent oxidoreductase (nitroreductase family)
MSKEDCVVAVARNDRLGRALDLAYFGIEYLGMLTFGRSRPGPVGRVVFRFPILLQRVGLGALTARNVLLIRTNGRRTGVPRTVGVRYSRREDGTFGILGGWRGSSQWFRNVQADPTVVLRLECGRTVPARARAMTDDEVRATIADYLDRNPIGRRTIRFETGMTPDGTPETLAKIAAHYPGFVLRPDGSA